MKTKEIIAKEKLLARMEEYKGTLLDEELSDRTIRKYMVDVKLWLEDMPAMIDKNEMQKYKSLLEANYAINSVNSKIISINRFLRWVGISELCLKVKRKQIANCLNNVISRNDYFKMIDYAIRTKRYKMYYIMKVIARTGIRIGELRYITVESIYVGQVYVFNKGKGRWVQIPESLCKELRSYCIENNILDGIIFYGNKIGKVISEPAVLKNMKYIAFKVGVNVDVVYPHSLRHLFAKTYMEELGDIAELADILGHSRIETTRIYTRTTSEEKRQRLEKISL